MPYLIGCHVHTIISIPRSKHDFPTFTTFTPEFLRTDKSWHKRNIEKNQAYLCNRMLPQFYIKPRHPFVLKPLLEEGGSVKRESRERGRNRERVFLVRGWAQKSCVVGAIGLWIDIFFLIFIRFVFGTGVIRFRLEKMSRLGFKSVVYHGDVYLGELETVPVKDVNFQFPNNEIRIHYISPNCGRSHPLAVLQTISYASVLCKLEPVSNGNLNSNTEQSPLINLHASCFYELKVSYSGPPFI